nr:serine/arginine repetitive matrix protein 1-like [Aegilops tauschii subsp. strangulata]
MRWPRQKPTPLAALLPALAARAPLPALPRPWPPHRPRSSLRSPPRAAAPARRRAPPWLSRRTSSQRRLGARRPLRARPRHGGMQPRPRHGRRQSRSAPAHAARSRAPHPRTPSPALAAAPGPRALARLLPGHAARSRTPHPRTPPPALAAAPGPRARPAPPEAAPARLARARSPLRPRARLLFRWPSPPRRAL